MSPLLTLQQLGLIFDMGGAILLAGDAIQAPWARRTDEVLRRLTPQATLRYLFVASNPLQQKRWWVRLAGHALFLLLFSFLMVLLGPEGVRALAALLAGIVPGVHHLADLAAFILARVPAPVFAVGLVMTLAGSLAIARGTWSDHPRRLAGLVGVTLVGAVPVLAVSWFVMLALVVPYLVVLFLAPVYMWVIFGLLRLDFWTRSESGEERLVAALGLLLLVIGFGLQLGATVA